jgi:hypothetical protein
VNDRQVVIGVKMSEWERYKIKGNLGSAGVKLNTVTHVAHVPAARRILEDKKIKAGLVYDESRLNTSRVNVTWVSANTWALGSIYGTVEFQFDWKALVEGKKVYWVEAIEKYNPPAYRFLLSTRENLQWSRHVQHYNPIEDDGPLRKLGDQWYWNGEFTSEFMFDEDLFLWECIGLDFVRHHGQICSVFRLDCAERKTNPSPYQTGGLILSHILARELRTIDTHLRPTMEKPRNQLLDTAYTGLHDDLIKEAQFGGVLKVPSSCQKALIGALALYGMDRLDSAVHMLTLLNSSELAKSALTKVVQDHFGMPTWTAPF